MKYNNLERCTELCKRIKELKNKRDELNRNQQKVVIVAHQYDGSFAIMKEWSGTAPDDKSEYGLYDDIVQLFISKTIERTTERIKWLESELDKL